MAVRDLLWGCPFCSEPGRIRQARRIERCLACHASFKRGRAANIVGEASGHRYELSAAQWLERLGPVRVPGPDAAGRILGPELVRVKRTTGQKRYYAGTTFLGWIETYDRPRKGMLELRTDGLYFRAADRSADHWTIDRLTGLQPASSGIQLGFRTHMVSLKFIEGSVRLWTGALTHLIRDHYERQGYDVLVLQPHIRLCRAETSAT
jgi:hypothetical protein